jgi:hypothetical protein
MASATVFWQERVDGGIREGIDYEGTTVLEHYVPGHEDDDPALLWYVDVRFEGSIPASSPESLRDWLTQIEGQVKPGLDAVADDLAAGTDGLVPVQRPLPLSLDGVTACVVATGIRRINARRIGERIRDLGNRWSEMLSSMQSLSSVA